MGSFMFELPMIRFWIKIVFESPEGLPSVFFIPFRRLLNIACKETLCFSKHTRNCRVCPLFESCLYVSIFKRRTRNISEEDVKYYFPGLTVVESPPTTAEVPRPFAITVFRPRDGKNFGKLGITLVGSAVTHFHSMVRAVETAGSIGLGPSQNRFRIEHMYDHFSKNILFDGTYRMLPEMHRFFKPGRRFGYLELKIKTPVCIKRNNRVVSPSEFNFRLFVNAVLSRALPLIRFFGGSVDLNDVEEMSRMSENISVVSNNLEIFKVRSFDTEKAKLEGLVGSVVFEGENLQYYYGLLKLGEALQIGKFTTFGFGCYTFRVT